MKKIVITGATGVIGMALINNCIKNNILVTVLVNPNSKRIDIIPKHELVNVVECDVNEYEEVASSKYILTNKWLKAMDGDAFYHLAWRGTFGNERNDIGMQKQNIKYTLDAVKLAHKLGYNTFVGVGSQAEYGRVEGVLQADTPCNPENEYGKAKLEAGVASRQLCSELGINHIWTRVLSVYGPYDGVGTMIISTVRKLLSGEVPALTKGEQIWDYLYSDDAARALIVLGSNGRNGQVYPLGSGVARPLYEYITVMRDLIDESLQLGFGEISYSDRQVMHLCADITNLKNDTGFVPVTTFEEGISRTIEWVKSNMRL